MCWDVEVVCVGGTVHVRFAEVILTPSPCQVRGGHFDTEFVSK